MENERPEALTPRGVVVDVAVSVALLLGTGLVTLIERQLPSVPGATGVVLVLLELALAFFAIGYALRAATYLWDQFSFLVEHVVNSATWMGRTGCTKPSAFGGQISIRCCRLPPICDASTLFCDDGEHRLRDRAGVFPGEEVVRWLCVTAPFFAAALTAS